MKDYSKFIPSSFGFITKYEIVGDFIYVYTPETKKGEPHTYPATKEMIAYIEKRMENQYQLIIENRDIIKENIVKNVTDKVWILFCGVFITLGVAAVILLILQSWGFLAAIFGMLVSFVGAQAIVNNTRENFDKEMDVIQAYLNNRKDIESLSMEDPNITLYLSKSAAEKLESNEELQKQELISDTFNIDFLDKIMEKNKLKDIKKLLSRYMISRGLQEEQIFVAPTEANTKKKSRKPKRNNPQNQSE